MEVHTLSMGRCVWTMAMVVLVCPGVPCPRGSCEQAGGVEPRRNQAGPMRLGEERVHQCCCEQSPA
eukprot:1870050-Heterocapsa_arctica.AAC.1